MMIHYYEIKINEVYNIKIYKDITSFTYKGFLGIGMTHYNYNLDKNKVLSSFVKLKIEQ